MYEITVQWIVPKTNMPSAAQLKQWAKKILQKKIAAAEVTIRIVDKKEMTQLNATYRHKNKPTNVLSFPIDHPPLLGDIVICAEVIQQEALEQNKSAEAHWAHMVVHGILHLLGYDHETNHDAELMETEEINILKSFGFANPYQIQKKGKK